MSESAEGPRLTAPTAATGRGEPLVLVPGGLTGWLSWEPHAEHLARERRVIRSQLLSVALGLQGEPLPPDYGLRTESGALLRALDDLAVDRADFVGWSYGGAVALDVALHHPERVRSLVLVEPDADWLLRAFDRFDPEAEAFQRLMQGYGPGDVSEAQLARFLVEVGVVPRGVDARSLPRWPVWVAHRQSLRIGDAPSRHEEDPARLTRVQAPVLLFKGEGSPAFLREAVELLARELPHARVEELPGGHALPLVSMERFLELLRAFLASPTGAAPRPDAPRRPRA